MRKPKPAGVQQFEVEVTIGDYVKTAVFAVSLEWEPGGNGWAAHWSPSEINYTAYTLDDEGSRLARTTLTAAEEKSAQARALDNARDLATHAWQHANDGWDDRW